MNPLDISPDDHAGPVLSALFAIQLTLVVLYGIGQQIRRLRQSSKAKRAMRELDEGAKALAPGKRFIAGTVELSEGAEFAARVEIRQEGVQRRNKNGWRHTWSENERRSFALPFFIRLPSGERVLVEPGPNVHLVDRLDITVHDEARARYRIAELSAGEWCVAEGLERVRGFSAKGYRDTGEQWVLRPLRGVERLHLSAEDLSERHTRATKRLASGLVFALPFLLGALVPVAIHAARGIHGRESTVNVYSLEHYTTRDSKGVSHRHYDVLFFHGEELEREPLDESDWSAVDDNDTLYFLELADWPSLNVLGRKSTMHGMAWFIANLSLLIAAGILIWSRRKEWFEQNVLREHGNGQLAKPAPSEVRVLSRE